MSSFGVILYNDNGGGSKISPNDGKICVLPKTAEEEEEKEEGGVPQRPSGHPPEHHVASATARGGGTPAPGVEVK